MEDLLGKAIMTAIAERTGGRKMICGICGGTRWGINHTVNLPLSPGIGLGVIGGPALPLTAVTCEVCGHTEFLNLLKLLGREKIDKIYEELKAENILEEAHKAIEEKGNQP